MGCSNQQAKLPIVESGNALFGYQLISAIDGGRNKEIDSLLTGDALKSRGSFIKNLHPEGCVLTEVNNRDDLVLAGENMNVEASWACPKGKRGVSISLAVTPGGTVSSFWQAVEE
jgi:hypothetical protein